MKSNSKVKAKESQASYTSNRIIISTVADLEDQDRKHTANMTFNQRMEYLQKLISITHSEDDLIALEKIFYNGSIKIRNAE